MQILMISRHILATLASGALILTVSACHVQPSGTTIQESSFPAESIETIEAPARIASLSYESTEVLAALGLASHIVLMPEAVLNPVLGSHQKLLAGVEQEYAVEKELTAEAVIDQSPDLVILSPRHGAADSIDAVLGGAGIETLITLNSWSTSQELVANVRLIGQAVGAQTQAEELSLELENGLTARADTATDAPRILVLNNQAGRPFITAGKAFPLELVHLSGGAHVSVELGIEATRPIQVEEIIAADPDGIILIDMNGTGDQLFRDILDNDAVAQLGAVTNGRMLRVEGKEVQALGLTHTITGLDTVAEWVASLR